MVKDKNSLGLDFPNLPYLIDGDLKLSQARTILTHLGQRFNLVDNNERETSLIELLIDQSNDLRQELNNVCNRAINFDVVGEKFCDETLPIYFKLFEDFLIRHGKKWLISDTLTITDFQLFEYLDHCWHISNDNWADYPKILAYMKAFRELPKLKNIFKLNMLNVQLMVKWQNLVVVLFNMKKSLRNVNNLQLNYQFVVKNNHQD